jgi:alkanesulfonate monooxygenase SsuD/methylene tetrahydromethanopterin reductase-like flavin-dependent oxidoreductase (luciferase family)
MPQIQFGWTMPSIPPDAMPGDSYVANAGTPSQVIEQMQAFIDLGVDYFILSTGDFPDLTTLEVLRHEVLPALNMPS